MVDEVQIVTRSDGHGPSSFLEQTAVCLVKGLMNIHEGIDNGLAMSGGLWQVEEHRGEILWRNILRGREKKRHNKHSKIFKNFIYI